MKQNKQPLKQALKTYYSEHSLNDKQLNQLQDLSSVNNEEQNKPEQTYFNRKTLWLNTIAASFLIFLIFPPSLDQVQSTKLITAAYSDIKKDASLNNGLDKTINQWMSDNNVSTIPKEFNIEMSRFCQLDQYKSTHLRVAGAEKGIAHFFFHQSDKIPKAKLSKGQKDEMNWQIVKLHANLSVLVIYTQDMREEAVQKILNEMRSRQSV